MFKRSAEGFDSVVVVMMRSSEMDSVVDFSSECSSLVPLVVYPPSNVFTTGEELPSMKVYFTSGSEDTVYVFKCAV